MLKALLDSERSLCRGVASGAALVVGLLAGGVPHAAGVGGNPLNIDDACGPRLAATCGTTSFASNTAEGPTEKLERQLRRRGDGAASDFVYVSA